MSSEELLQKLDRMTNTADTLAWLGEQAEAEAGNDGDRARMLMLLAIARSYVLEYAAHCSRGASEKDAIVATIRGELDATENLRRQRMSMN